MSERERLLEDVLSEGLDLCVRARKLDDLMEKAVMQQAGYEVHGTRCATPALWIRDQYDRDLAAWEEKARRLLLPAYIPRSTVSRSGGE